MSDIKNPIIEESNNEVSHGKNVGDSQDKSAKRKAIRKIILRTFLFSSFVIAVILSIVYISKDSQSAIGKKKSVKASSSELLTPDYIPNSVIYASKEEIRVYKVPPSKKSINEERFKKELEARKLVADVDAKNVSSLLPPFLKSTGKCFDVERAGLFSLVKSEAEVMNYDKPAWWTVKNETGNAVAVILNQSGKDIMVAFIPVGETMSTRIPASYLKFSVRYSRDNCVDWGAVYGPTSNMPEIPFVGLNNPYLNGVFETKISNKDKQVKAETTLTGFTE